MGLLPPPVRGRLAVCGRHLGSEAAPGSARPRACVEVYTGAAARHATLCRGQARPGRRPPARSGDQAAPARRQARARPARAVRSRASMAFSAELWRSIEPIYAEILAHPFVRGLTDGSLPREAFRFYAVQDALYLRDFALALSLAAARAPRDEGIIMFNEHAAGALKVERSLHESFFAEWGLTPEAVASTPLAPTNLAYTSYLLAVAHAAPFHEAVAALLPCYWIYWEVGKELEHLGSPDPLYARWIGTYASKEFGGLVTAVLDVTNQTAERFQSAERELMSRHFVATSRYEWMFWDMGWRKESWPV